jgi:tight adherence protein B
VSTPIAQRLANVATAFRENGTAVHRWLALGFVFTFTLVLVYRAVDDPRGLVRRVVSGYVAGIDAERRAMFQSPIGSLLGYFQACFILLLLGIHGIHPWVPLLFVAGLAACLPAIVITQQGKIRRRKINDQAHGFALTLANSLKATASIGEALKHAAELVPTPLQDELGTVLRQVRIGSTIEEGLLALSARIQAPALDVVVSALLIGRQTGGDLPRILEATSSSLRELKRLEDFTDKVTRDTKMALVANALFTIIIVGVVDRVMPSFFEPLRTTTKGQLFAMQAAGVYLFALYLGYQITRKSV